MGLNHRLGAEGGSLSNALYKNKTPAIFINHGRFYGSSETSF
jgi:hypothetical protein